MERITLEVSDDFARKWKAVSEPDREKMLTILSKTLDLVQKRNDDVSLQKGYGLPDDSSIEKFSGKVKEQGLAYQQTLDKMRKKAKDNGLTEDILEYLLND